MPEDKVSESSGDAVVGRAPSTTVERHLGLWDAISLIVGIVVGTAIFRSSPAVFGAVPSGWGSLGIWALGGLLALTGGLCFAELTTTFPHAGGDYRYLALAYGRTVSFLFGWAQLSVILTGSIGSMAYVFGDYSERLWPAVAGRSTELAMLSVVGLVSVNLLGFQAGRWTQHVLSAAKVLGLLGVVVAAVWAAGPTVDTSWQTDAGSGVGSWNLGLALIFVLYAYGGWNDAAFVAAEVQEPQRNLPLAMLGGVSAITVIYLLVNWAYLRTLGLEQAARSTAPAADVLAASVGGAAERIVSLLVMISALGAINGLLLTGSRLFAAWGSDFRSLQWLASWNSQRRLPVGAMLSESLVSVLLIWLVGSTTGRQAIDWSLARIGIEQMPWNDYGGGFVLLLASTAPVFWLFFLMTILAVVVLRWRAPEKYRPFRVPLYPVPVLVFAAACGYMLAASLQYARQLCLLGVLLMIPGVVWLLCLEFRRPKA